MKRLIFLHYDKKIQIRCTTSSCQKEGRRKIGRKTDSPSEATTIKIREGKTGIATKNVQQVS